MAASIGQNGAIAARVNLTGPKGLPLDRNGVCTPGPFSMSFIAAYIPANRRQYVSHATTTAKATLNTHPSQIQAADDSGGTLTQNGGGDYAYTSKTRAPAGFDATATHAIGVSAQRNLTWSEMANDVFNFVPNGAQVTVVRPVAGADACNNCHNPNRGCDAHFPVPILSGPPW